MNITSSGSLRSFEQNLSGHRKGIGSNRNSRRIIGITSGLFFQKPIPNSERELLFEADISTCESLPNAQSSRTGSQKKTSHLFSHFFNVKRHYFEHKALNRVRKIIDDFNTSFPTPTLESLQNTYKQLIMRECDKIIFQNKVLNQNEVILIKKLISKTVKKLKKTSILIMPLQLRHKELISRMERENSSDLYPLFIDYISKLSSASNPSSFLTICNSCGQNYHELDWAERVVNGPKIIVFLKKCQEEMENNFFQYFLKKCSEGKLEFSFDLVFDQAQEFNQIGPKEIHQVLLSNHKLRPTQLLIKRDNSTSSNLMPIFQKSTYFFIKKLVHEILGENSEANFSLDIIKNETLKIMDFFEDKKNKSNLLILNILKACSFQSLSSYKPGFNLKRFLNEDENQHNTTSEIFLTNANSFIVVNSFYVILEKDKVSIAKAKYQTKITCKITENNSDWEITSHITDLKFEPGIGVKIIEQCINGS